MTFQIEDNVKIIVEGKLNGIIGTIKKIDFLIPQNKNNYLIEGEGLSGAIVHEGFCEHCKQNILKQVPNSRWFYEEMIEKVN
jgi:hypothetical protein